MSKFHPSMKKAIIAVKPCTSQKEAKKLKRMYSALFPGAYIQTTFTLTGKFYSIKTNSYTIFRDKSLYGVTVNRSYFLGIS